MRFWSGKRVFVTGCNGFLGSWLTKTLSENGAEVTGLIRDIIPNSYLKLSGTLDKINVVYGGLEDYRTIERALNEHEIQFCFHLGAQAIVSTANRSPISTFEANIKGTWTVLEAARCTKLLEGVIVASSDKAYGIHEKLPYTEDAPLKGSHPYDVSKSCSDLLAQSYFHSYGLPVSITRCGNIYGGGDLNFTRIVPGTIKSVIHNETPVIRSDGKFTRDYIYVSDIVDGYLKIAENMKKAGGEAFNFSNENPVSVIELFDKIIRISGKKMKPRVLNEAKNEIRDQYLSSKKSVKTLGWKSKYSLEDGLREAFLWYREFFQRQLS